jgi:hypothetical protein
MPQTHRPMWGRAQLPSGQEQARTPQEWAHMASQPGAGGGLAASPPHLELRQHRNAREQCHQSETEMFCYCFFYLFLFTLLI